MKPANLTGGCLCGAVRFSYEGEIGGDLGAITLCQCSSCRRAQGYAVAAAPATRSGFRLLSGAEILREYESSPRKVRAFCGVCGSPIYSRRQDVPEALRLRLGAFDELPDCVRIEAVIHARNAPSWMAVEGAPAYGGPEPGRAKERRS